MTSRIPLVSLAVAVAVFATSACTSDFAYEPPVGHPSLPESRGSSPPTAPDPARLRPPFDRSPMEPGDGDEVEALLDRHHRHAEHEDGPRPSRSDDEWSLRHHEHDAEIGR